MDPVDRARSSHFVDSAADNVTERANEQLDASIINRVKGNFHNNVRIMTLNRAAIILVDEPSFMRLYRGNECLNYYNRSPIGRIYLTGNPSYRNIRGRVTAIKTNRTRVSNVSPRISPAVRRRFSLSRCRLIKPDVRTLSKI